MDCVTFEISLGEALRSLRTQARIDLHDLAYDLALSVGQLADIEAGELRVTGVQLYRAALRLDVSITSFLTLPSAQIIPLAPREPSVT